MKISDLRSRITIQQKTRTPDGIGGATVSWTDLDTVWARVESMATRERYYADKLAPNTSHQITIRYRTDITAQMRVMYDGRMFSVVGDPIVKDEQKKKYLVLYCVEGDAA